MKLELIVLSILEVKRFIEMETPNQLATRFREVYLDGKWIANTNLKEQLSTITWEQATQKVEGLNTLAALTYHLNYYLAGVLNVFRGGELEIRDKYSFDVPEISSQEEWELLLQELLNNAEHFVQHVEKLSEEQLKASFVDEKYGSYRRNIEGVIEHSYYHMGQISLIKKLVEK